MEASLVMLVFLAFIFLVIEMSWGIFAKVTLQHAVRAGARYAVTSRTMTVNGTALGQVASIQQTVQKQSMGLITNPSVVSVTFYSVNGSTLQQVSGTGSNAGGNLVVVALSGFSLNPIAPLLHSASPILISVSAGDLIESAGSGSAPPPL